MKKSRKVNEIFKKLKNMNNYEQELHRKDTERV